MFLISAGTCLLVTTLCYWSRAGGIKFLEETYFYHLWRKDIKHSFSVYFYFLYLSSNPTVESFSNSASTSVLFIFLQRYSGLLTFFPQLVVTGIISHKYYHSLGLCFFLQTLAFVVFNKVCTVQYFIWYFSLLPLAFVSLPPNKRSVAALAVASIFVLWLVAQIIWLFTAFQLEFKGENVFFRLWIAGILFFWVNVIFVLIFPILYQGTPQRQKSQ
jgi:phosphatidylinositol glycan class M